MASTIIVNKTVGQGDYTTMTDAIAHAQDGDTIKVAAGDYTGELIDIGQNKKLTIEGTGAHPEDVIIDRIATLSSLTIDNVHVNATVIGPAWVNGSWDAIGVGLAGTDLVVKNSILTIDANGAPGADQGFGLDITYNTHSVTIENVVIGPFVGGFQDDTVTNYGVWLNGSSSTSNTVSITDTTFQTGTPRATGIAFDDQIGGPQIVIENNQFEDPGTSPGAIRIFDTGGSLSGSLDYSGISHNTFVAGHPFSNETGDFGGGTTEVVTFGGSNLVQGSDGDDYIFAVAGNDSIDGGCGVDTYDMTAAGTGNSIVDLDLGIAQSTGTGFDRLVNIENIKGGAGSDILNGDSHNNTFFASDGADTVDGRDGSDTFDASSATDTVIVDLSNGIAVSTTFSATLHSIENVNGGAGDDEFKQSADCNVIDGGAGVDTVKGYAAGATVAFDHGHWTVKTTDGDIDTLTNVEQVVIGNKTYLLVDQAGNGYGTVQAAVDAAHNGDKIIVAAGTYNEHLVVDKDVTIEGANAGVSGSCARCDETIITWDSAETILLKSDGITLDGLKVVNTGGNDGISIYVGPGIVNNPTNLLITNNVVDVEGQGTGVDLYNESNSSVVTFNTVTNNLIYGGGSHDSYGVLVYNESYADISCNTITGVAVGIQTGNNHLGLTSGAGTPEISDNIIDASRVGIYHNLHYGTATAWTIDCNTVTASAGADPNDPAVSGIRIMSISSPDGATVTDNDVSGFFAGYQLWNDADGVTIEGGTVSCNTYGIEALHNHPTYNAAQPGTSDDYTIDGVNFDNNGTDVRAENTDVSAIGDPSNITTVFIEGDGTFDAGDTVGPIDVRSTGDITASADATTATLLDGDSNTQTFDDMDLGVIANTENGWTVLPGAGPQAVVDDVTGNHVFQISSDPSNGNYSGPYSPKLDVAAGEKHAGAAYQSQSISFDFKAVSDAADDFSRIEVDFANEAGNDRNNFLVIETTATGIRIAVSEPDHNGDFSGTGDPFPNDWRQLISNVDASVAHHLEMRLDYVDGANNDVIGVYLDGVRIGETTTFENYHDALGGDHDTNAAANFTNRIIFRESNNGQPTDGSGGQNRGFTFDNLTSTVYNNTSATGNDQDNVITGNTGDNTIDGLGGSDSIDGRGGIDTATGYASGATLAFNGHWTVTANGDVDTLTNVEKVVIDNKTYLLVGNTNSDGYQSLEAAVKEVETGETIVVGGLPSYSVNENAAGASIGTLTTADGSGSATFTVLNDARFTITGNQLALASGRSLDYETTPTVEVMIEVTDHNNNTYLEALRINVTDVNENSGGGGGGGGGGGSTTNHAPTIGDPQSFTGNEDIAISGAVTGVDQDGDALTYAVATNGNPAHGTLALATNGTFTYTPAADYNGADSFTVTITDGKSDPVTKTIALTVSPVNDAPILVTPPSNQNANEGEAFSFALPGDTFTDIDADDVLSYTATLAGGAELPSWLHFDPATQTFTGTPEQPDIGSVQVTVTAKDLAGATADTTFTLAVAGAGGGLGDIVLSNSAVDENSDGGTVVGLLSIPDAADGAITYSLSHNPHDAFAIVDGKLVVADGADLDFETKNHYKITVDATDTAGTHFDEKFTIDIDDVLETPKGTPKPDVLIGDAGNNTINGRGSDDVIKGMGGDDHLAGGRGDDELTGNAGADVFILGRHFGHDVVTRFDLDEGDRVNLKHADGIDNFNDLINNHVEDHKHGVLITADDGSSLLLKHVVIDDLKADDFIF